MNEEKVPVSSFRLSADVPLFVEESMTLHQTLVEVVLYMQNEFDGNYGLPVTIEGRDTLAALNSQDLFCRFRALVNQRPAAVLPASIQEMQDTVLRGLLSEAKITDASGVPARKTVHGIGLGLWQGDITRLKVDAIVNAANSKLLGCWIPLHRCIDNAIHTFAGVQLRSACQEIMQTQGHDEETGRAKITPAFNLPSEYILHTVGPIISGRLTARDEELLSSCYRSCLDMASTHGCESVAFCCISTGEFRFPNQRAAEIAVDTVSRWAENSPNAAVEKVVFNVFKDCDYEIYRRLLG